MLAEAIAAVVVGGAGLWLVVQPLFERRRADLRPVEPLDPEETPQGVALAALKEIDFDRETGKLSESDYQLLKARYTALALDALRREETQLSVADGAHSCCPTCGPRPEPDAVYCSACGVPLAHASAAEPASLAGSPANGPLVIPPAATARQHS